MQVKKERLGKKVSKKAVELVCQAGAQTGTQTRITISVCSQSFFIIFILQ